MRTRLRSLYGDGFKLKLENQAPDGVVQRPTLECENLVFVAQSKEPLHLVGMHGRFVEEGENGNFPDSEFGSHIVQMNYIVRAI